MHGFFGLGFLRMWENMDQENLKNRQFHVVLGSVQSPASVFQALFPYKDAWQIVKYFFFCLLHLITVSIGCLITLGGLS